MRTFYEENGYLVVTDLFSPDEVKALQDDATTICRGGYGETEGMLEGPSDASADEILRQYLCIHFPHKISPVMNAAIRQRKLVETLIKIIGPNVKCMQSMLFIKGAGKPGQAWHQDEDFIPTRDRSLTGAWISLDRATVENGCLWVIPGSHRAGILWDQVWHADQRFDCTLESQGFPYTEADEIPVEVDAGSVVFFNGYLLHRSLPNRAKSGYRRALVNHYMNAASLLPWFRPAEGVSMALADYRDVEIVAGTDPYAHRGYENKAKPHVRPSGEGGCVDWKGVGRRYETDAGQ